MPRSQCSLISSHTGQYLSGDLTEGHASDPDTYRDHGHVALCPLPTIPQQLH